MQEYFVFNNQINDQIKEISKNKCLELAQSLVWQKGHHAPKFWRFHGSPIASPHIDAVGHKGLGILRILDTNQEANTFV